MRPWRIERIATFVLLLWPIPCALADEASERLLRELSGQGPVTPRTDKDLETAYTRLLAAEVPAPGRPELRLETIVHRAAQPGAETHRRALVAAMLASLEKMRQPNEQVFLLGQLRLLGREESVPLLARLLNGQTEFLRQHALYALEANPAPAAGAAIAKAVSATEEPAWRLALVNALGNRREGSAVRLLGALFNDADQDTAAAAMMALGNIGTAEAAAVLAAAEARGRQTLTTVLTHARIVCADRLREVGDKVSAARLDRQLQASAGEPWLKLAALRGLAATHPEEAVPLLLKTLNAGPPRDQAQAASLLVETADRQSGVKELLSASRDLTPPVRALLLIALFEASARSAGGAALREAARESLRASDEDLRVAAARSLRYVGTAADMIALAELAAPGPGRSETLCETAMQSLAAAHTPGTEKAILEGLVQAEPKVRVIFIRCVSARRLAEALPLLVKATQEEPKELRVEACRALMAVADDKSASTLVSLLLKARPGEEQVLLQQAVAISCRKVADPAQRAQPLLVALAGASAEQRRVLLAALGRIGGSQALEVLRAELRNADMQDAAVHALSNWPDAAAAEDLLKIAHTASRKDHRRLALRALARVVAVPSQRPPQEAFVLLKQAIGICENLEDKRYALSRLAAVRVPESIDLARSYLADPLLQVDAATAIVRLAKGMKNTHPQKAQAAVQALLDDIRQGRITNESITRHMHLEDLLLTLTGKDRVSN